MKSTGIEIAKHRPESRPADLPEGDGIAHEIPRICALLSGVCGHDFTNYRTSTLTRRIRRRMQMRGVGSAEEYTSLVERDSGESQALFRDLLINVTAFFRDPHAFQALAQLALPELVRRAPIDEPIRVWVPGCATGQEAYSLAILLSEELERSQVSRRVQIFATDIDERCLRIARQGLYPATALPEVKQERIRRFFHRRAKRYAVAPELREMCVFSPHNAISDPPFSRIDLISCRNLLIYLGVRLQRKLVSVFHYSLRPGGYLFLGPSETILEHSELFRTVDGKSRISQKKRGAGHAALGRGLHTIPKTMPTDPSHPQESDLSALVRKVVLTEFAPPHAVVDADFQVTYLSAQMTRFLQPAEGPFHNNLLKMVHPGLRVALRAALHETIRSRASAVRDHVSMRTDQGIVSIRLTVRPLELDGDAAGALLVAFQEEGYAVATDEPEGTKSDQAHAIIEQLERELTGTRNDLSVTIQELEAANEELKSSNEELLSMNEELHSTNEELETSKEEVQRAFDALAGAKDDLENLLGSTRIATIFLSDEHEIQGFTPAVATIYNLLAVDIGRKLTDIAHRAVAMPPLPSMAETAAANEPIEHEVQTVDGLRLLRRVLPYRTRKGETNGLVVTFVDVTELRESEGRYQQLVGLLPVAVYSCEAPSGVITFYNEQAARLWGRNPQVGDTDECFCGSFKLWLPDGRPLPHHETPMAVALREGRSFRSEEVVIERPDGTRLSVLVNIDPIRDATGKIIGAVNAFHDISERKHAEEAVLRQTRTLATINRVNASLAGELDLEKLVQAVTDAGTELTTAQFGAFFYNVQDERGELYTLYTISGVPPENFAKFPMPRNTDLFGPTFRGEGVVRVDDVTQDPRYGKNDPHFGMPKGHLPVRSYLAVPVMSRTGEVIGGLFFGHEKTGVFTEDHEQVISGVAAQAAIAIDNANLFQESRRLAAIVESTSDSVIGKDLTGRITSWNEAATRVYGYSEDEAVGQHISLIVPEHKRAELDQILDSVRRGEPTAGLETERLAKDGRRLDVLLTVSAVRGADGRLIGSSVIARDISDRKRAEEELLRTTGRLSAIISTAVDGIVTIDGRGTIESVNPAAVRLFGYTADEMVGRNVKMLMPEPFHGEHDSYVANYLRTGERKIIGIGREVVGRRKDGSTFPMELAVSETKLGKKSLFTGIVRDITERRRVERDRAWLASIVSSSDDAIVSKNLHGIIQTWNKGAERLFGYSAEEAIGRSIIMLIPPQRHFEEEEILRRISQGERIEHYETVRVRKDGRYVDVSLTVSPIRNASGEVIAASKIARNIGERKRQERSLANRARQQTAVAQFGGETLGQSDLQSALDRAAQVVTATLDLEFAKVLELLPGGSEMLLRAGVGWHEGLVGEAHVSAGLESQAGYTLIADEPVVLDDLATETRFSGPPLLKSHSVTSGMSAVIRGPQGEPWGVLGAHSRSRREFSSEDVAFLSAIANVLSAALERSSAEESVRKSEEQFRTLANTISQLAWMARPDGWIYWYNQRWYDYTGTTPEQMAGWGWQDVHDPQEVPRVVERWKKALAAGEPWEDTFPLLGKDGQYRWFLSRAEPIRDARGRIVQWFGTNTDVSSQRTMEQALRESEEQFRRAIEEAPIPVIMHAEDGKVLQVSRSWTELTGYTLEETPVVPDWLARAYGYGGEDISTALKEIFGAPDPMRAVEFELVTRHGEKRVWSISASSPGALRDGRRFVVAMAEDITERKAAEVLVRQSEQRYRSLAHATNDVVWTTNARGEFIEPQPEWESYTGQAWSQHQGLGWLEKFHPDDRARLREWWGRDIDAKRTFESENRLWNGRGGEWHAVIARAAAVRGPNGEIVEWIGTISDIHDLKLAEESLRQSEERYRKIFQSAYVSIWQEDFTAVKALVDRLRDEGVGDLRAHFREHPDDLEAAIRLVRVRDVNEATLAMFEAADLGEVMSSLDLVFLPETRQVFVEELIAVAEQRPVMSAETRLRTLRGRKIDVLFTVSFPSATGDWSSVLVSLMDVTERREAERALRESEQRLRIAVENAPLVLYHCDRELRYTWFANEPHGDYPIDKLLGRTPLEVIGESARPLMDAMQRVLDSGTGQRIEFSLDTSLGRQTWDIAYEPLRDFTDSIIGVTGSALEITERKQAEERQQLLLAELSHRVKNTLATVQSVATQTAMHAESVPEFRKAFEARLHSLAQTHSLLTRGRWRGAELRAIVVGEMGAHGGVEAGRVTLTGPTIYLTPKAALSLHLVLHELATNAAKYGALSTAAGRVDIRWSIEQEAGRSDLRVVWVEAGGPKVSPPKRRGFGTTVIENSVDYELDGQTTMQYLEEGLHCEIVIPWRSEVGYSARPRDGKH